ncbi:hypothetical protein [Mobiluncus mulieris]|uniref:hypothetical protein n=1 Tax=Mobiluncus mulieris TaxID=2052 RepID=UPI00146FCD5D|nr:hypothetical protein [Mobiluncus mulieris]NMX11211.1 hypothetical protein [Mobiluncus mulieris]
MLVPIGSGKTQGWWHSPRVYIGIILIALAMMLTFVAIRVAGHMDRYWAAKDTILAGQSITKDMLVAIEANPGVATRHYFPAAKLGQIRATQTIGAGELLSRGCVSSGSGNVKKIVLKLASPLPSGVSKGDYLEIWQLPNGTDSDTDVENLPREAHNIAPRVVFVSEKKPGVAMRVTEDISIEILVENKDLEDLLAAVGLQRSLVAIPVAS